MASELPLDQVSAHLFLYREVLQNPFKTIILFCGRQKTETLAGYSPLNRSPAQIRSLVRQHQVDCPTPLWEWVARKRRITIMGKGYRLRITSAIVWDGKGSQEMDLL